MNPFVLLAIFASVPFLGCEYSQGFLKFPFLEGLSDGWWYEKIKLSTYGLMLATGFLVANFLIQKEFNRLKINPKLGDNIIIVAVIAGIIGSKIFFVWETSAEWKGFDGMMGRLFSGGGLTWYGGLVVASTSLYFLIKKAGFAFLRMSDILTPLLASGYGFGRLGCLFSGDGCYGEACPASWPFPFAMKFPNGAAPWSEMTAKYGADVQVYNTPLFEALFSFSMFLVFWLLRKKEWPVGLKFVIFIMAHSVQRFLIEFIRLNPRDVLGVTQGQFISLSLLALSLVYFIWKRQDLVKFVKGGFKWNPSQQTTQPQ